MRAMWGVGGWGGVWGSNRQTEINRMPIYSTDNRDHFRACGLSDAGSVAGAQAGLRCGSWEEVPRGTMDCC